MEDIRLLRVKEFKGDALVKFLAVLVFNEVDDVIGVCSNVNLGIAGMKLGLEPLYPAVRYSNEKIDPRTKAFANAYEVNLWEFYVANGLQPTLRHFKETALLNYMETCEAESVEGGL